MNRRVGNNWLPMACLALLFLSGGAADLSTGSNGHLVAVHYSFGTVILAGISWLWFRKHRSNFFAPSQWYLYLASASGFLAMITGAIAPFRGLGAWVVLSLTVAVYGYFERARVLVTAGSVLSMISLIGLCTPIPVFPGLLQGVSAAVSAAVALRLHTMVNGRCRPKPPRDLSNLLSRGESEDDSRLERADL